MSHTSRRIVTRLFITLFCLYLLSPFGATFNGIIIPDSHRFSFGFVFIALILWLWARWRGGWLWHKTAIDLVLPIWAFAILATLLANPEGHYRSAIGLFFAFVYIGSWYAIHDLLSNHKACREWLLDGLLSAGLVVMIFSALQMLATGSLIQPVSLIGNTNALGTVLVVITPFALGRALNARRMAARYAWSLYSILMVANLLLTLSRGAWLGLIAALGTYLFLTLVNQDMVSWRHLTGSWKRQISSRQRMLAGGTSLAAICVFVALALILNSFSIRERRAELRGDVWQSALQQFAEKPLAGHGLFTFAQHNVRFMSVPPAQGYFHAHNLPLNIAAEMGFLGLVAFIVTVVAVGATGLRRWKTLSAEERPTWICAASALAGYAVHHLFDVTAMMPAIAWLGLLLLAFLDTPSRNNVVRSPLARLVRQVGFPLLWIAVIISGLWTSESNRRYIHALRLSNYGKLGRSIPEEAQDYQNALNVLDEVIASDPAMPVYYQQKAVLWGLIAARGEESAIAPAINTYKQFLKIEPNHSISWANLAALYWQSGDREKAVAAMRRAVALAPDYGLFVYNLAAYYGIFSRDKIERPHNRYNQEYTRYEYLREALPLTFLPQVAWGT